MGGVLLGAESNNFKSVVVLLHSCSIHLSLLGKYRRKVSPEELLAMDTSFPPALLGSHLTVPVDNLIFIGITHCRLGQGVTL